MTLQKFIKVSSVQTSMSKKMVGIIAIVLIIAVFGWLAWQQLKRPSCRGLEGDAFLFCKAKVELAEVTPNDCQNIQDPKMHDDCLILTVKSIDECSRLSADLQETCQLYFANPPEPSVIEFETEEEYLSHCTTLPGDERIVCEAKLAAGNNEPYDCSIAMTEKGYDECKWALAANRDACPKMKTPDMKAYCEAFMTFNLERCNDINDQLLRQKCASKTFELKKS